MVVLIRRGVRQVAYTWNARALIAAALALVLFVLTTARARAEESGSAGEYEVKAAFLFKFTGYVEWPPDAMPADTPLAIGVLESEPMADELARVASGRSVGGHAVAVRRLKRGDSLAGLHAIFVGRGAEPALPEVLHGAHGRALLVVTESEAGLGAGGTINFIVVDHKVRFDVALAPAEAGSLKISSRLLTVARKVVTGPS